MTTKTDSGDQHVAAELRHRDDNYVIVAALTAFGCLHAMWFGNWYGFLMWLLTGCVSALVVMFASEARLWHDKYLEAIDGNLSLALGEQKKAELIKEVTGQ